jgi:hypothetical protein
MPDARSRVPSAQNDHCPAALKLPMSNERTRLSGVRPNADPPDRRPESWKSGQCCYEGKGNTMGVGRPLRRDGRRCLPPAAPLAGPGDAAIDHWHTMARAEHASVAAFEELSEVLIGFDAPAELVMAVRDAARDEARHAEICFEEVTRMTGQRVLPGVVPSSNAAATDLRTLALQSLEDGCFEETLGAVLAAELALAMPATTKRAALERIARDELGHAELSFRIVAFCLEREPGLHADLTEAVQRLRNDCQHLPGEVDESLEHLGVPAAARVRGLARDVIAAVVEPCVAAMRAPA